MVVQALRNDTRPVGLPFLISAAITILIGGVFPQLVSALTCPFCSAEGKTLTQELNEMDVVVIARLEVPAPPAPKENEFAAEVPKAKFRVQTVVKGGDMVDEGDLIEAFYFGDPTKGKLFQIRAMELAGALQWSSPTSLNQRSAAFVLKLPKVPRSGPDRLAFFQEYLEDADALLARDAYDEFAIAPYSDVAALKDRMNHDRIVGWLADSKVSPSRRRLYFTLLGICGTETDVPMLEAMIRSDSREQRSALDALLACYLTLKGETGIPVVEELYLGNPKSEYQDVYASIMAMRFHLQDVSLLPKQRVVQALRLVLDNPQQADLVIKDLADYKDWSCVERLVQLFMDAEKNKTPWMRVPVIVYLRRCPLPEAKQHLARLEKADPEAAKRATLAAPSPLTVPTDTPSKS